ncbi:AAA domain-containing protein [Aquimarina sp. MMG016]|uniref:AAA domain-containing protein n=1 Tax=Aquimarina sp. MMG016 TaxID=2822690 RepID=UPI001B3A1AE5|nr:AAA domain-containing protein [Aquimarina sp. MMG016]MBQ4821179.1 AAA family ATPase [Aquimarina sp. MMG016]
MDITSLVKYFSDCYKADNREFSIDNFFSAKFENQFLQDLDEELINGKYKQQYIPDDVGEIVSKNLQLYKRDKQLFYCSLFLLGKRRLFNKRTSRICAPIFFYPSKIIQVDEDYFIEIYLEERQVNYGFLRTLDFNSSFESFQEEFNELLSREIIDYPFIAELQRLFDKHMSNVTFSEEVHMFPKLIPPKTVKRYFNSVNEEKFDQFQLLPASGAMVSSKATNVQNVVNELEQLTGITDYSSAIQSYLGDSNRIRTKKYIPKIKPFILNTAQENSIKAANERVKSVIIGPPGTGKSYMVAAIAMDYISQGKSVLIATRTDEALQVISNKLESFSVGRYRMKAGGARYKLSLIASLEKFLFRFNQLPYRNEINKDWSYLGELQKRLKKIESEFSKIDSKSIELTETILEEPGIIRNIKIHWLKLFKLWQQQEWKLIDEYMSCLRESIKESNRKLMGQLLGNVQNRLNFNRQELQGLVNSLRNDDLSLKSEELNSINFKVILGALPIWLVKIDKAAEVLPLKKEMFDLLIIDESTQCDMAGVLPLMQRAKKMVITGDPKQLRHMSFLSKQQMFSISKKYNIPWSEKINYRSKSLLDFVLEGIQSSAQLNLLNEHYRSLPDIIKFSNEKFYDESLLIMNDLPKYKTQKSVFIRELKGKRNSKGVNEVEAVSIIKLVKKLIFQEDNVQKKQATSIGIISPFKDQVTYIGKAIRKEITLKQLHKHNIRLGTPYSFQGDERDIILISMAVDNDSHHSALNYLNRSDVFNVMITRARNIQEVFLSVSIKELKFDSLLRDYIERSMINKQVVRKEDSYLDEFVREVRVFLDAKHLGINYHIGYQLSGLVIDILIEKDGKYLGIDLIGYPGDFQPSFSIERYKVLYRVGIQVIPLSYMTWYFDEKIKEKLSDIIKKLG